LRGKERPLSEVSQFYSVLESTQGKPSEPLSDGMPL
jgi:hypothetical protein